MKGIYFYTIGIAFTSGIFIRSFFYFGWAEILLCIVMGVACAIAGQRKASGFPLPLLLTSIALLSFALGMARMHYSEISVSSLTQYVNKGVLITARVVREPEIRESTINLYVEPSELEKTTDELILVATDRFSVVANEISYGDVLSISGKLTFPKPFETDGGRVFDYTGYLKARGVSYTVPRAEIKILENEQGTFMGYLFRTKKLFQNAVEEILPEPYAGLGEGLLLGVKRALGKDLEGVFRQTGIIHIVVLSGYNIMIVVESILFVLSFFFFPRTRMAIGIIIISLFALLVGLSATVVRAAFMAGLLLIARTTGRTYAVLRALILTGIGMLMLNPYLLIHDPGFQLSFLATLGLILLAPHIEVHLTRIPRMLGVRGFLTATIATQLFVLPILLYQMGTLSIVAIFVNVLVLPMVPPAMFLTFITGICGLILPGLGYVIGFFAYLSLSYIIHIAKLFASLPFASFSVQAFPFWIVIVAYVIYTFLLMYLWNREGTVEENDETDEFADWTFEEEHEKSPETQGASGDDRPAFPFR